MTMQSEKRVPIDEELYTELVDIYQDLEQDVIRATSLEYGDQGVDPAIVEQALILIDRVLTAYDYYADKN